MKKCKDCGALKSNKGLYCKKCGYKHRTRPVGLVYIKHKINPTSFKKGVIPWNKGLCLKAISEYGDDKSELHKWIRRNYGEPLQCEYCGKKKNIEWANKSNNYLRKRDDWMTLCRKCHHKYDFEMFGCRKSFFNSKKNING